MQSTQNIISSIISLEKAVLATDASTIAIYEKWGNCDEVEKGIVAHRQLTRLIENLRRELARPRLHR